MTLKSLLRWIFLISIGLNVFLLWFIFNVKPPVIYKDKIVEKPIKVVEVVTRVKVVEKVVIRPTNVVVPSGSTLEAILLHRLESANPVITVNSILIYQNKSSQWVIPRTVSADMSLDYLSYKLLIGFDAKILYNTNHPSTIVNFLYKNAKLTPSISVPFGIPFTELSGRAYAGTDKLNIYGQMPWLSESNIQVGVDYVLDNQNTVPYFSVFWML